MLVSKIEPICTMPGYVEIFSVRLDLFGTPTFSWDQGSMKPGALGVRCARNEYIKISPPKPATHAKISGVAIARSVIGTGYAGDIEISAPIKGPFFAGKVKQRVEVHPLERYVPFEIEVPLPALGI